MLYVEHGLRHILNLSCLVLCAESHGVSSEFLGEDGKSTLYLSLRAADGQREVNEGDRKCLNHKHQEEGRTVPNTDKASYT